MDSVTASTRRFGIRKRKSSTSWTAVGDPARSGRTSASVTVIAETTPGLRPVARKPSMTVVAAALAASDPVR
jgi:hypothetical protein